MVGTLTVDRWGRGEANVKKTHVQAHADSFVWAGAICRRPLCRPVLLAVHILMHHRRAAPPCGWQVRVVNSAPMKRVYPTAIVRT